MLQWRCRRGTAVRINVPVLLIRAVRFNGQLGRVVDYRDTDEGRIATVRLDNQVDVELHAEYLHEVEG